MKIATYIQEIFLIFLDKAKKNFIIQVVILKMILLIGLKSNFS